MTHEQLKYIRDWARSGNAWKRPCLCTGMPMEAMRERWGGMDGNEFQLNSAGLTIAKLADALELTGTTCEAIYTLLCADPSVPPLVKARASGMMADVARAHEEILGK